MKPKTERPWYRFTSQAKEGDSEADLYVYDIIGGDWLGEGVTAKQFVRDLEALPASVSKINLHINSPGGSVFDATAIANVLKAHRAAVNVEIEGLAASAATVVAMAGDRVGIAENAMFMIHNPAGFVMGGAEDMRATADALDRVRDAIVATYRWHSHLEPQAISTMMAATTWMTAAEAVEAGFATEVSGATEATAAASLEDIAEHLGAVPDRFRPRFDAAATVKVAPTSIAPQAPPDKNSPPLSKSPKPSEVEMTEESTNQLVEKARAEGFENGRTAERERILGVEAALIPGHEKLIAELKRDPAVTPGDAALKVNAAERLGRENALAAIKRDGEKTAKVTAAPSDDGEGGIDPNAPLAERAKYEWDHNADLRAEYEHMGGFNSFLAWKEAEASGVARVLKAVK